MRKCLQCLQTVESFAGYGHYTYIDCTYSVVMHAHNKECCCGRTSCPKEHTTNRARAANKLCLYLINCHVHRICQVIVRKRNLQNYLWIQSNTKLHSQKLVRIGETYYCSYWKEGTSIDIKTLLRWFNDVYFQTKWYQQFPMYQHTSNMNSCKEIMQCCMIECQWIHKHAILTHWH